MPAAAEKRRTIIVGDVHGCYDELCELLDKVAYCKECDTLIFAGDLVNKGPQSVNVVRLARQV
jgi:Icc-related predicted phosphoesterase